MKVECQKCGSDNTTVYWGSGRVLCHECKYEFALHTCKKLDDLSPVVAEGQMHIECPSCKHYYHGLCANPSRHEATDPCPFDGKPLPTTESEP